LVQESEIIEEDHYTIIGFVLFKSVAVAQRLIERRRIQLQNCTLLIEKIKQKEGQKSPRGKRFANQNSSKRKRTSKGRKRRGHDSSPYAHHPKNSTNNERRRRSPQIYQQTPRQQKYVATPSQDIKGLRHFYNELNEFPTNSELAQVTPRQSPQKLPNHQFRHNFFSFTPDQKLSFPVKNKAFH
jgi:hypothetical protein